LRTRAIPERFRGVFTLYKSTFTLPLPLPLLYEQVKFTLNDKTTLSDLLSLNLHKYEDEVKNIVDKAVKEMSMEKVLKELNTTWTAMEFEHTKHPRTGITLLQTSEELIETLEDNQVHFQIKSNQIKFIRHS